MTIRSVPFATAIVLAAVLTSPPALAQTSPDKTAGLAPAVIQVEPAALPLTLTAGPITAELMATSSKGVYVTGGSAFAQLKLSSQTESRRGVSAELLVEAEQGDVVDVTGAIPETTRLSRVRTVHIGGIRKGRSLTLLIEVKLRAEANKSAHRLKLTLRVPADDGDGRPTKAATESASTEKTVLVNWPVSDCGRKFHAALRQIGENGGAALRDVWRNASRPDSSMPRGWLFRPSMPKRPNRRQKKDQTNIAGLSASDVRAIYREAHRMISAGYDPELRERGEYGWTVARIATDLRQYFRQEMNPAICTGALGFADYYDDRLSPLRKHGERLAQLAGKAETLARARAAAVFAASRDLPGGHPAWGGAALAALKPQSEGADMKTLLVELLEVAQISKERIDKARGAEDAWRALAALDDRGLRSEAGQPFREMLHEAVAAVEIAVRFASFRERQEVLLQSFHNNLEAIRAAKAEHCTCGS